MMNNRRILVAFMICVITAGVGCVAQNSSYWEATYLEIPNPELMREYLRNYTSAPHIAGSMEDKNTALYTKAKFEEFGITAVIEEHEVLLTYPIKRTVEIIYPDNLKFKANLTEPVYAEDPTSNDPRIVDTFNGYAPSGNATAELVYANYGRLADFQYLQSIGVNVSGKIVIVRYGQVFRGVKVMVAQQFGAVGVLIYSDPIDDGFVAGDTFPNGPWRPEEGVQRGSVQYLSKCPGDPLAYSECLPEGSGTGYEGTLIPNIPVQPISWGDAAPLLAGISNNVLYDNTWIGAIPNITYAIGPGPVQVHLETEIMFNKTTIWNVVATIEGVDKDNVLLIGNHRDAWVFGATDPSSGSAVLLEIARSYGVMLKQGWKPKRSVILCSWDAEEYGLVGSTAYTRSHKKDLVDKAVAYLNVDVGVGGWSFGCGGTPSLRYVIEEAAGQVAMPYSEDSILASWGQDKLYTLGSGSDYTAFLDNLGIASMDAGFWNLSAGVYHSNYDSFYWMETWGDKDFLYHRSMAEFIGLVGLKIVDSVVLPHNYVNYAQKLLTYATAVADLLNSTQGAPDVHLSSIISSANHLLGVGQQIESERNSSGLLESTKRISDLNRRLVQTERQFIYSKGLPGRPFYKHVVQAPALYSGYGSDVYPGLMQSIRDMNWDLAKQQAQIISDRIMAAADTLSGKHNKSNHKKAAVIISVVLVTTVVISVAGFVYWRKTRNYRYQQVTL